ncbi:MAG: hypothetical protein D3913_08915 [Candidatus Electrothrix sp. LOE1_4_5]|nr:hypothetical protein [Candidatus Electrothrix gigas]
MGWIGLGKNLGKIGMGVLEGDMVKVVKSSGKAIGHAVSGVVGIVVGDEVKESIDEFLDGVEEADSD